MDETTIIGDNFGAARAAPQAAWQTAWIGGWSGVSWSAAIAGALTAIAVTVIIVSLGSGIGMALISPYSYSSPSAGTMTVIGAVWLVFAQAVGFAAGGYVAGRLRRPPVAPHDDEVKFRDGANGLVVWAIGVVVMALVLGAAIQKAGSAAGTATGIAAASVGSQAPSIDYFTDSLLRSNPQGATTGNTAANSAAGAATAPSATTPSSAGNAGANATGAANPNGAGNADQRTEVDRILLTSLGPNGLSNDDRTYLVQLVSARTGLSQADAQHRVDDVLSRAKQDATQAADAARKAAAYLSFWTFMSLLFGAVCATLGGVLGGDLRDELAVRRAVPAAPR